MVEEPSGTETATVCVLFDVGRSKSSNAYGLIKISTATINITINVFLRLLLFFISIFFLFNIEYTEIISLYDAICQ